MIDIETMADNIARHAAELGMMAADHMLDAAPSIVFRSKKLNEALALRVLLDRKHARLDDGTDPLRAEFKIGGIVVAVTCPERRAMRDGRTGGVGNMHEPRDFAVPF